MLQLRVIENSFAFDHRLANCEACTLVGQRDRTECPSAWPKEFNGLALIGEGPGATEASMKVPFIGPAGKLLDRLLTYAGIERSKCFVGNATSCQPPYSSDKKGLMKEHPAAVHSCRPRLLAELQFLRPRVIVALGGAALGSLTGREEVHCRREPNPCTVCNDVREWRRWGCTLCKHVFMGLPADKGGDDPEGAPCDRAGAHETCQRAEKKREGKWQARNVSCAACGGHKTRVVQTTSFVSEHPISYVAGAIFRASELPIGQFLHDADKTFIIPTYHPSHLLRKVKQSTAAEKQIGGQFLAAAAGMHLKKAARLLQEDPTWLASWRRIDEPAEILAWAAQAKAMGERLIFDIETDNQDPYSVTNITCIGFSVARFDFPAMVVDTDGLPPHHPRVQAVVQILTDPTISKGAQNGIYDISVIDRIWNVWVAGYDIDTITMHHAIAPDEPHDLHHIGFAFTDTPAWKPPKKGGDGKLKFESKDELHEYNARDTKVTAFSIPPLLREVENEKVQFCANIDLRKFKLAFAMRKFGMPINRKKQLEVGAEARYRMEVALRRMRDMVGEVPFEIRSDTTGTVFNPHAPRHLVWALFSPDGPSKLLPKKYTESGDPSTDKEALLAYVDHPLVQALREFKSTKKTLDDYVENLPIGPDGRIHPEWAPLKVTGRWGSSPNMQNWQTWARSMIEVADGRVIVGADMSQVEMRIIAFLSQDADLIHRCISADEDRKLEPEHDPHSFIASNFFGETYTRLSLKDPAHDKKNAKCACETCTRKALRVVAKTIFYALGYGGEAETIHRNMYLKGYEGPPITVADVDRGMEVVFRLFPGIKRYRDSVLLIAQRTGKVVDLFGGRTRIYPLLEPDATVIYNHPIQSSCATLMDVALWNIFCDLPGVDPSAGIFAQVHDAIYVEASEDRAREVADLIERHMNVTVSTAENPDLKMPLPATAKIALDWKEAA